MKYSKQMRTIFWGLIMAFFAVSLASAEGQRKTFTLKDGTKVKPVIRVIDETEFNVKNPLPGKEKPKDDAVVPLPEVKPSAPPPSPEPSAPPAPAALFVAPAEPETPDPASEMKIDPAMQAVINKILASPELVADIQAIADDPEAMAVFSDPAFIAATQAKDLKAIEADSRTAQLIKNPKVKKLIQKIQALK